LVQRIENALERRSALCRDVARGHVGTPPYVSYPRRARTPRRRSDHRSLRCDGGNSPVTPVASGPCQVAPIHRPAHRPWHAIGRRSDACRRPCCGLSTRACVTGVTPLAPNRPSAGIKTSPGPCLARTPNHRRAPPPAICAASVSSLLRPLPWLSEHAQTFPLITPSLHACVLA
jgi:hypothetical protein